MSGLLHRLAAQATGRDGPRLHSLARIPYVAPLELADEGRPQLPQRRIETTPAASTRPMRPEPTELVGMRSAVPEARQPTFVTGPPPLLPALSPDAAAPRAPGVPPTAEFRPSERQRPSAAWPSELFAPAADSVQNSVQSSVQGSEPAHTIRPRREGPPDPLPNAMPEPLLGPERPQRSGQPFEGHHLPNQPETTEVHVHIGRIEVTAVQEASPERPKRPLSRGPMSLDEYLNRRKEERK